jgi:hypothetical protein
MDLTALLMPILGTLIRHGLTTVGGGILVGANTDIEALVGAVMTLLGAVLSLFKSYGIAKDKSGAGSGPDPGGCRRPYGRRRGLR